MKDVKADKYGRKFPQTKSLEYDVSNGVMAATDDNFKRACTEAGIAGSQARPHGRGGEGSPRGQFEGDGRAAEGAPDADRRPGKGSRLRAEGVFTKYVGKSGSIWLIRNGSNPKDGVYAEGDGQGFGGIMITFVLDDGTLLDLKGPYHCNLGDFQKDTGAFIEGGVLCTA